jgi:hypothetical protein
VGQFLHFFVHKRWIEVNERSIELIKKIKPPTNKVELYQLIGKTNFIRRFILNLSGKIEPITPLLKLKVFGDVHKRQS